MASDKMTMKIVMLTPKEVEEIVRRVVREEVQKTKKRKPAFRTTLRKER